MNIKTSAVVKRRPNSGKLVTAIVLSIKINEVLNKVPDNSNYITTQKNNKLTAQKFAVRLKQADLVNFTDFN